MEQMKMGSLVELRIHERESDREIARAREREKGERWRDRESAVARAVGRPGMNWF